MLELLVQLLGEFLLQVVGEILGFLSLLAFLEYLVHLKSLRVANLVIMPSSSRRKRDSRISMADPQPPSHRSPLPLQP